MFKYKGETRESENIIHAVDDSQMQQKLPTLLKQNSPVVQPLNLYSMKKITNHC